SGSSVCENAVVEASGFTTLDATIVSKVAYISDFTLTCSNGAKDISLYAETSSGVAGVARSLDGSRYQVSWISDIASAPSGVQDIKLFDEQGYSALKKAQRSGESSSGVKPLATISLYHPGAYRGPWVQSETIAVICSIAIFYYAFKQKSIITE
ncbi:translocon-associated protein subunit delta, partial [Hyalella azteca]|uniref:Translocon-associated protein subunit delta n=1 Tax=Hyalella azteca TaxID=294128 RepID=A0A8B7NN36_HYAAZ